MTTSMPIHLECPNCNTTFRSERLTSTNSVGLTTDLHRITNGYDPLQFMIHSCPSCGFTGQEGDMSGTVSDDVAAFVKERIWPHVRDERAPVDARWEFCAMIAERRGASAERVGQYFLNAAWSAGTSEREHYYRRKTADQFEAALASGEVEDPPTLMYLIGEMYRRVGDVPVAHSWYDQAIEHADGHPEADRLREVALQQKEDPQDRL